MSEHETPEDNVEGLVGDFPDPNSFTDHGEHRPKKKHGAHGDHPLHVNINSLLDVLSVILVFLMKSYSASSINVKPSKELQLPFTRSIEPAAEPVFSEGKCP